MKKLIFLSSILLALTAIATNAQTQPQEFVIKLSKPQPSDTLSDKSTVIISADYKLTDIQKFKGIPSDTEIFGIYSITLNNAQSMYDMFKNSTDKTRYYDYIKKNNIDTTYIDPDFKGINRLSYYVGTNSDYSKKCIIVDMNDNMDFSDDRKYTFVKDPKTGKFEDKDVNLILPTTYFDGRDRHKTELIFTMRPKCSFGVSGFSSNDSALLIDITRSQSMTGKLSIDNDQFRIYVQNYYNSVPDVIEARPLIGVYRNSKRTSPRIGDTVVIADRKLYFDKVKGDNLYVQYLGVETDSSALGSMIPELNSYDIYDHTTVNINKKMAGKFVFIDFWGSWCNPCVASLPKLKELYNKIKDRKDVAIIGITLEQSKDLLKLQDIIKEQNIEWFNAWNHWDTERHLISAQGKLKIKSYPSYVIIDKTGKIVFTTNDPACKRDKAIEFFLNLIAK